MVLKLVSLIEQTLHTTLPNVLISNDTLIVIRMMTMKMFGFLSFGNPELTGSASFFPTVPSNPMNIVLVQELLISVFNHTFCDKHNVDGM